MAVVYWLKAPHHTDYETQGYIGVSIKTSNQRYIQHKHAAKRGSELPVHRAIRKYGGLEVITLYQDTEEMCYLVEGELRPIYGIGYNAAPGGSISPTTGVPCKEETKKKIGDANRGENNAWYGKSGEQHPNFGRKASEEEKLRRKLNTNYDREWMIPRSCKTSWYFAAEIREWLTIRKRRGFKGVAKDFGLSESAVQKVLRHLTAGWIPEEDHLWKQLRESYVHPDLNIVLSTYTESKDKWVACRGRPQVGRKGSEEGKRKWRAWRDSTVFQPWDNPACNKEIWIKADIGFSYISQNPSHRQKKLADALGVGLGATQVLLKRFDAGWNPSEDPAWLAFKEQYLTEQEANNALAA